MGIKLNFIGINDIILLIISKKKKKNPANRVCDTVLGHRILHLGFSFEITVIACCRFSK